MTSISALLWHGQSKSKALLSVGVPGFSAQPSLGERLVHALAGELGADLGSHQLSLLEFGGEACPGNVHDLVPKRTQMHLDPLVLAVIARHVSEAAQVEVRLQLTIDHRQDVQVELRRHPLSVVVGSFEHQRVLHQVHAQQERVLGTHQLTHSREERSPLVREEVADGAAEEHHQLTAKAWNAVQVLLEVADDGMDGQTGKIAQQVSRGALHDCVADVERLEPTQLAAAVRRFDEQPRLGGSSRAELQDGAGLHTLDNVRSALPQDRGFSSR